MSPTSSSGSESAPRRKDVSGVPVRESGLVGTLFVPVSTPMGGVLVLGGSDGSIPEYTANQLAQAGFSALALAWFGHPGLPAEAIEVPLEYFHRALRFLQARAPLRGAKVGIWGNSKGAEAALLVAASYRDVAAVVGVAASGVAWHGLGSGFKDRTWMRRSTWTRAGDPVPFVPGVVDHRPAVVDGALVLTPMHLAAMQDAEALQRAAIAVERIKCPVLLISGEEDQLWPSQELRAGDEAPASLCPPVPRSAPELRRRWARHHDLRPRAGASQRAVGHRRRSRASPWRRAGGDPQSQPRILAKNPPVLHGSPRMTMYPPFRVPPRASKREVRIDGERTFPQRRVSLASLS